jgi:hypothetical protein
MLYAARPVEPAALAAQLRGLIPEEQAGGNEKIPDVLAHIAEQLEVLARGLPEIRAALLAVLQHHGGDLEEDDEPGLDESTRDLEAQMRGAIKLLDQAAPPHTD